ncbi:hypothetical protein [Capnocytophaga leadbetteri]
MRVYEFLQLSEEMQRGILPVLKVLKPLPNYICRHWFKKHTHGVKESITELTFGDVNTIKREVMRGTTEGLMNAFELVYKCTKKDMMKMNVVRFYRCMKFITNEVDRVMKLEHHHWKVEPTEYDGRLQDAGVKELEMFGDLPMIDSLAGGDILRYNDIEGLNYLEVHYVLWYRAIQTNIQNRFQKLMANK